MWPASKYPTMIVWETCTEKCKSIISNSLGLKSQGFAFALVALLVVSCKSIYGINHRFMFLMVHVNHAEKSCRKFYLFDSISNTVHCNTLLVVYDLKSGSQVINTETEMLLTTV